MSENKFSVEIDSAFSIYAEQAIGRLRYLYPDISFSLTDTHIHISGICEEPSVRRDVTYQLYREKIYQEGLPMRELMYKTLLA